jgi:D-alanine-D-alanine ligase
MVKEQKHIEIVRSSTATLSSMSRASCAAIYEVLSKRYTDVGVTVINTPADLQTLLDNPPDLVFLGMEFVPVDLSLGIADPDKIWIGNFLDARDIAYTGSASRAHELQRNKNLAKQRVLDSGLSTSPFCVAKRDEVFNEPDLHLEYPLFVKPTDRGGGLGIDSRSVVHNFNQLSERISYISRELRSGSLIEQYLTGREFSVSVFKDILTKEYIALPVELIAPLDEYGARLLSGEIKSSNTDQAIEVVDSELSEQICSFGLDVFSALGARDYGRIDIRLDSEGTPQFLEANLLPSLISGYGSFPRACVINLGLQYEDMIYQIVDLAFERKYISTSILSETDMILPILSPAADILLEPV